MSAGEELVGVALVADVEQKSVMTEIKDVVHGDREFDHSEVRCEMATGLGDLVADCKPDFRSELLKLFKRELLQIGWT